MTKLKVTVTFIISLSGRHFKLISHSVLLLIIKHDCSAYNYSCVTLKCVFSSSKIITGWPTITEMQTKYYYVDIDKTQSLLERIHSVDLSVAHEK